MKSKAKSGICFVVSIICFIIAFMQIPASESFKPTRISFYANDTYVSQGSTTGQPGLLAISNVMLWTGIIMGVIFLILAICFLASDNKSENSFEEAFQSSMFVDCPNCGEINTTKNEYCFKCHQRLSKSPLQNTTSNKWYCPVCGKENQGYVGTCGCGTRKP